MSEKISSVTINLKTNKNVLYCASRSEPFCLFKRLCRKDPCKHLCISLFVCWNFVTLCTKSHGERSWLLSGYKQAYLYIPLFYFQKCWKSRQYTFIHVYFFSSRQIIWIAIQQNSFFVIIKTRMQSKSILLKEETVFIEPQLLWNHTIINV